MNNRFQHAKLLISYEKNACFALFCIYITVSSLENIIFRPQNRQGRSMKKQ